MSDPTLAPERKDCIACGNEIPTDLMECPYCHYVQVLRLCAVCKKAIPLTARRCNNCDAFQDRLRRHLPGSQLLFTVLAVLFGVLSTAFTAAAYLLNLESNTTFKVASSDDAHIILKIWDTGRKPSSLVNYRLNLGNLNLIPAKPTSDRSMELNLGDAGEAAGNSVIAPGNPITISLTVVKNLTPTSPCETIMKQLANERLTLEIDVEESNDPCCFWNLIPLRPFHTRRSSFPANRITNFIKGKTKWPPNQPSAAPCPP